MLLPFMSQCPPRGCPTTCSLSPRTPSPEVLYHLAPFSCRVSYDAARFPRLLPEAYCLCLGCLTGPAGAEDTRFRSTPVYAPAVVLRRTPACAGGRAVYREDYVALAVGCTCVPEPEVTTSPNASINKPGAKPPLQPSDKPAG